MVHCEEVFVILILPEAKNEALNNSKPATNRKILLRFCAIFFIDDYASKEEVCYVYFIDLQSSISLTY